MQNAKFFKLNLLSYQTLQEGIKYIFVGGACTVIDFLTLFLLTEFAEINYLFSSIASFILGVCLNYFLCTSWIFKVRLISRRYIEFSLYVLISIVGLGINTLVIWWGTHICNLYFMFSKLIAAGITLFWNFFGRKYLLHFKIKYFYK